jgi:hypothetical protein
LTDGQESDTQSKTGFRLTDGIVISVLTATAYLMAFAHEAGFAHAFAMPFDLIDLQLMPALFATLFSLGVLVVVLFQVVDLTIVLMTPTSDEHPALMRLRPFLGLIAFAILVWMIGGAAVTGVVSSILVWALVMSLWVVLLPLLLFRVAPRYRGTLSTVLWQGSGYERATRVLFGPFWGATVLALCSLVFVALSFTAGYARAKRQTAFYVANPSGKSEAVVLRIYGSRVVTAEFVRSEHKVKRVYQVHNLGEAGGLSLHQETVGPLYLEALK